jgi:4'-phosphopantetheinyl transferase
MNSCPVDIWTIPLDELRPIVLSADEHARANRFRFERDRVHWSHARSALRTTLALYVNRPPEELKFTCGEHGKPSLDNGAGIEFNISHSRGWAMIAITKGVPVGIDIEEIRENVDIAKLLHRLNETELVGTKAELFQVWTRREARTKAVGGPLMEIPIADLRVIDLKAPEGFAASVALEAFDPVPVLRRSQ